MTHRENFVGLEWSVAAYPFWMHIWGVTKLKAHIFVCTNERPAGHPRGCCKEKKSEELVPLFKQELSKVGVRSEVRAQRAGCLDTCEFGPAVVVYPDNVWYGNVRAEDVPEIVQSHIINGQPVERLRIPGK
jgi:(2Fe-2S) ferredoxin